MTANRKRFVRTDLWIDATFDERLAREQDITLRVLQVRGNPTAGRDLLAGAHV